MKASILQENFNQAIALVSRAINNKGQLPVLNNILIATDAGRIKLTATNLETGINYWVGGKIEKEGKITIPAKIISETIATLPKETVFLEAEKEVLKISCGRYKAEINGINPAEFPAVPSLLNQEKGPNGLLLSKEALEKSLSQVILAAAIDESRPVFTGVKIETGPNKTRLAATDGYRLSVKTLPGVKGLKTQQSLIVPARALLDFGRILAIAGSEAKEVLLAPTTGERQLILAFGDGEVVTRLLEGEFPDFDKIIPVSSSTQVEAVTEELEQAVKAALVFARDSANIVRLRVRDGVLMVSANSPQVGENKTEVEIKKTGEDNEIAFNGRYLIDMLGAIGTERVNFSLTGSAGPGMFKPAGEEGFLHVIMPVRLQG